MLMHMYSVYYVLVTLSIWKDAWKLAGEAFKVIYDGLGVPCPPPLQRLYLIVLAAPPICPLEATLLGDHSFAGGPGKVLRF